jgi:GrpB-like predicted nucleotidyltransferase (UPF0157 family)
MADPIVVVDYDPRWPGIFAQLRDRIAAALGSLAVRVEHIGSTAVPYLAASPVLDLDVVIARRDHLPTVIRRLQPLGYRYLGDPGAAGRHAFLSAPGTSPHHLAVCSADSPALARHLVLRDLLRADPQTAQAYEALKRCLAVQFRHDPAGYADAKTAFTDALLVGYNALPARFRMEYLVLDGSGLGHPDGHPEDPTGPVRTQLDRRRIPRDQPRSNWSQPGRR